MKARAEDHLDLVEQAARAMLHRRRFRDDDDPYFDELVGDGNEALARFAPRWSGPDDEFRAWVYPRVVGGMIGGLRSRGGRTGTSKRKARLVPLDDPGLRDHPALMMPDVGVLYELRETLVEMVETHPFPGERPSHAAARRMAVSGGKPLTAVELAVLECAALGDTAPETAAKLIKSVGTIKQQRKTASAKLGARSITHAVALALARGILDPGLLTADDATLA